MKNTQRGFIIPLVIIIVAALAIGAGVHYANKAKKADDAKMAAEGDANATTTVTGSMGKGAGTLRSLLAIGKNVSCTYTNTSAQGSGSGTMYISGEMMRGDFTTTATSTGTVESHMIRNGNDVFVWSGSQGAKMNMSALSGNNATTSGNASVKNNSQVDLDQNVDYSCTDWTPDQSKFALPTGVNFIDLEAIMKAGANVKVNLPK